MTIELQKVQSTYDNTTAKSTTQVWQYNCKKYNTRMTKQLQKVQCTYDNATAKSTIHIWQYNCKKYNTSMTISAKSTIYV